MSPSVLRHTLQVTARPQHTLLLHTIQRFTIEKERDTKINENWGKRPSPATHQHPPQRTLSNPPPFFLRCVCAFEPPPPLPLPPQKRKKREVDLDGISPTCHSLICGRPEFDRPPLTLLLATCGETDEDSERGTACEPALSPLPTSSRGEKSSSGDGLGAPRPSPASCLLLFSRSLLLASASSCRQCGLKNRTKDVRACYRKTPLTVGVPARCVCSCC